MAKTCANNCKYAYPNKYDAENIECNHPAVAIIEKGMWLCEKSREHYPDLLSRILPSQSAPFFKPGPLS